MNAPGYFTRGKQRDELIAVVALLRADVFSPIKLSGLLDYVGSAVDLLPLEYGGVDIGAREVLLDVGLDHLNEAEHRVSEWEVAGLDVCTVLDPAYPVNLQAIYDKPPLVFTAGTWDPVRDSMAVSVVGTRKPTTEGCKRAYRLAFKLAAAGVTVISGLAKGIDSCAHRGALRAGGRTVAVMGTGISRRYPKENVELAERIVGSGGALVSQFFPTQHPARWTFPVRNVTMSGLSLATIVVEAGETSGAKMQAESALTHGRTVFLPRSLVASHQWARNMVERGFRGAFACEVGSPEEVIDRLNLTPATESLIA